jgi:hypothetical protein
MSEKGSQPSALAGRVRKLRRKMRLKLRKRRGERWGIMGCAV